MFIEIEDLKLEPLHVRHVYPVGMLQFKHEDIVLHAPVATDFVLNHKEADLQLQGTVETVVRYRCSRCLREVTQALAARFDLTYLPQPKWNEPGHEIELKYEDMDVGFYDGIRFDVDLMVLEQIELSLPMRFVCREDCRGLCPHCGADLNEAPCNCKENSTDSRLAVLLEFRNKMKKQ